MANQAAAKKSNVTPAKLALIGVLAVVLVAVLYIQYGETVFKPAAPSNGPVVASAKPRSKTAKSNSDQQVAVAAADDTLRKSTGSRATWQAPELASVVAYDPFALPALFPQSASGDAESALAQAAATTAQDASVQQAALEAERTQSQSALAALQQQGVQVIVKRGDKYVAIIGDQEVHVGDEFQGFKVVSIDATGVRLAKDLSP